MVTNVVQDLVVLRLTVNPPVVLRRLYQTDAGEMFRRREGSVAKRNIPKIQARSEKVRDVVKVM